MMRSVYAYCTEKAPARHTPFGGPRRAGARRGLRTTRGRSPDGLGARRGGRAV